VDIFTPRKYTKKKLPESNVNAGLTGDGIGTSQTAERYKFMADLFNTTKNPLDVNVTGILREPHQDMYIAH
jgi:hypothetical protein